MAGSYQHIVDENNILMDPQHALLDNLGDAYETIEELYYFVNILADWDKAKINDTHIKYLQEYQKVDNKSLNRAKRNPIFPDAGFTQYSIPRRFKFLATGDIFELSEDGNAYIVSDQSDFKNSVPLWIIENSSEWREIK